MDHTAVARARNHAAPLVLTDARVAPQSARAHVHRGMDTPAAGELAARHRRASVRQARRSTRRQDCAHVASRAKPAGATAVRVLPSTA